MAGNGPGDLQSLAVEYLDACIAALDTIPTYAPGLGGAPVRTFISPGVPALDCCPQLSVHAAFGNEVVQGPSPLSGGRGATFTRVNHVTLVATIARCIPTGSSSKGNYVPPSEAEISAAAKQTNADAWALWNHLYNLVRAGQLFTLCGGVFWEGLRPLQPSGGCGGWTLTVRVATDGYEEEIGT
jgi:hypothetical protein